MKTNQIKLINQRSLLCGIVLLITLLTACSPGSTSIVTPVTLEVDTLVPSVTSSPLPSITSTIQATTTPDAAQTQAEMDRQASLLLSTGIETAINASAAEWHIQIQRSAGSVLYSHEPSTKIYVGNLIHLPLAMVYLKAIESTNVTEIKKYLAAHGDYTTTYRQTMYESTVYDDQDASARLLSTIPDFGLNITETLQSWGAADTNLQHGLSSAKDLNQFLVGLVNREFLSEESSLLIMDMLDQSDQAGDPLWETAPAGTIMHEKRVDISGQGAMLMELAVIETNNETYLISILGIGNDPSPERYADLVQTYKKIADTFWEFTRTN